MEFYTANIKLHFCCTIHMLCKDFVFGAHMIFQLDNWFFTMVIKCWKRFLRDKKNSCIILYSQTKTTLHEWHVDEILKDDKNYFQPRHGGRVRPCQDQDRQQAGPGRGSAQGEDWQVRD